MTSGNYEWYKVFKTKDQKLPQQNICQNKKNESLSDIRLQ